METLIHFFFANLLFLVISAQWTLNPSRETTHVLAIRLIRSICFAIKPKLMRVLRNENLEHELMQKFSSWREIQKFREEEFQVEEELSLSQGICSIYASMITFDRQRSFSMWRRISVGNKHFCLVIWENTTSSTTMVRLFIFPLLRSMVCFIRHSRSVWINAYNYMMKMKKIQIWALNLVNLEISQNG